ncbi:MAG: phage tail protein [Sterolibacterium sp.]|nr:phage tail protein [Sterolibacterium sp.]
MKKLIALRKHLADNVPSLGKDPDRLDVYIENGSVACRFSSLSYEYRYKAHILVKDFTDHADTLIVPLLAWISINQPDLLLNTDKSDSPISFDAEILDHDKVDVELMLELTERVIVREDAEQPGHYTATHCDEPVLPDLGGPAPWQVFVNGTPVEEL